MTLSEALLIKDNTFINDEMRLINGDSPAVELEDGTQKGCAGCDEDLRNAYDYEYMAYRKYKSLEEKNYFVLKTTIGNTTKTYPFKGQGNKEIKKTLC